MKRTSTFRRGINVLPFIPFKDNIAYLGSAKVHDVFTD